MQTSSVWSAQCTQERWTIHPPHTLFTLHLSTIRGPHMRRSLSHLSTRTLKAVHPTLAIGFPLVKGYSVETQPSCTPLYTCLGAPATTPLRSSLVVEVAGTERRIFVVPIDPSRAHIKIGDILWSIHGALGASALCSCPCAKALPKGKTRDALGLMSSARPVKRPTADQHGSRARSLEILGISIPGSGCCRGGSRKSAESGVAILELL